MWPIWLQSLLDESGCNLGDSSWIANEGKMGLRGYVLWTLCACWWTAISTPKEGRKVWMDWRTHASHGKVEGVMTWSTHVNEGLWYGGKTVFVDYSYEAPAMARDNFLYLMMTRVERLWSTRLGRTCMTKSSCFIYCNLFAMTWLGSHLCSPWLACSMIGVQGLKKIAIALCWWACAVVLGPTISHCVSWVLASTVPSTFGCPHIPLLA